jgi:hypothetical protein
MQNGGVAADANLGFNVNYQGWITTTSAGTVQLR